MGLFPREDQLEGGLIDTEGVAVLKMDPMILFYSPALVKRTKNHLSEHDEHERQKRIFVF
jgi:hypothetical protein